MIKDKLLTLEIDGFGEIAAPSNIPTGGVAKFNEIATKSLGLFALAGLLLTVFFIAWGGVRWATSGGDKTKLESARKMIIYSIVGFVVIVFSFILLRIVGELLDAPFLKSFGQ